MILMMWLWFTNTVKYSDSNPFSLSGDKVVLKGSTSVHSSSSLGLKPTGSFAEIRGSGEKFSFDIYELPLTNNRSTENLQPNWCVNGQCLISPRTYYQPVTFNFSLVGFTDDNGNGHVWFLDYNQRPYHRIVTLVNEKPAMVAGLYGFHDGSIAVLLFVDSNNLLQREMWLQFYRSDHSVEWSTSLNSPISVPDRTIGDFRLAYGVGYFLAYFSVFGVSNFANNTNGEQVTFVSDNGFVKSTSFIIPGQEFVTSGDVWGCSHSLAQLAAFHSREEQFTVVCNADSFPEGISDGDVETGSPIFRANVDGHGSTSAQLGQIAESNNGFKLIFNAENQCSTAACQCCPAFGVGFTTIYNDRNKLTGSRDIDDIRWLTDSDGKYERDAVMARMYIGANLYKTRERFLVGWHDTLNNEYLLGIVNKFGLFVKDPVSVSGLSFSSNSTLVCESNCIYWGNRDNSFQTLYNGHVSWIFAPPRSKSVYLYKVSIEGVETRGWSLWSPWSRCSRSCGTGYKTRVRFCLENQCNVGSNNETKSCNEEECEIPVTCYFNFTEKHMLEGDLFVNGLRVFGYTSESAQEKCIALRGQWMAICEGDVCRGITKTLSGGFSFYFLKTGTRLMADQNSTSSTMKCEETPGWSRWSTWFACSVPCGTGTQVRRRFCDGDIPGSVVCKGQKLEDQQPCNTGKCPAWSEWGKWSLCSTSCDKGFYNRTRICVGDYPDQCSSLLGPQDEVQSCSLGVCPSWSSWSTWSACSASCGDGIQVRTRHCFGDFNCPEDDGIGGTINQSCFLGKCAYLGNWLQWGACSASCSDGIQKRMRLCLGDFPCPENQPLTSNKRCSLGLCSYWLEWVSWSECSASCDYGLQTRTRDCFGDFPLQCFESGTGQETKICSLGQCGVWSDWLPWGPCSHTCGNGLWSRTRKCVGDVPETCVGSEVESASCDVNDCIDECTPNPCNNEGICRANDHLARMYHCVCAPGWMGKHCDQVRPDLICGPDNIVVTFDRRIVESENLIADDASHVSLASRDSVICTALFDHYNFTEYYLLVAPAPIDSSCGSYVEVSPESYVIKNHVKWEISDVNIRSTVILIDFECIYLKNVTISSDVSSSGSLTIDSFHREVKLITADGTFDVDISLFRDSLYQQTITPEVPNFFLSLAEGEVVFVSVDLKSKNLLPSDNTVIVMDTCFVTSHDSNNEPLMYLVQDRCPSSPFVTVLSNGVARSGRFSVRIFGWTGRDTRAENVFIHCAVSVCNNEKNTCAPQCESERKKRGVAQKEKRNMSQNARNLLQEMRRKKKNLQRDAITHQMTSLSSNGHPYTSIVQIVPPLENGKPNLNLPHSYPKFDHKNLVSAGPLEVILKTNVRSVRDVSNSQDLRVGTKTSLLYNAASAWMILSILFCFALVFILRPISKHIQ